MSLILKRLSTERESLQVECLATLQVGNDLCKEKLCNLKVDVKKEDYGFQGPVNLVDSQTTVAALLE